MPNDPLSDSSENAESYQDEMKLDQALFKQALSGVVQNRLITVQRGTTVKAAVQLMNKERVGCVLILDGESLVGIFTERDVMNRILGEDQDQAETLIDTVMTSNPDTLPETASVAFALHRMAVEGYRHVPVLKAGRPIGVVSVRGVVDWFVDQFPRSILNLPPQPGFPKNVDGG